MKQLFKQTIVLFLSLFVLSIHSLTAQTKADIFNETTEITWLGLDFSQAKILGPAYQYHNTGEITNSQLKDKYIPEWNRLFINEMKKYDVAGAVHRTEVKYLIEVTGKANDNIEKDFFTNNTNDLNLLNEKKVADIIKAYNFQNANGIGLLFIVEGLNKADGILTAWVTFVNVKTKTVLFTQKETGKVGGFGFRNYWAAGFYNILKEVKSNFHRWSK